MKRLVCLLVFCALLTGLYYFDASARLRFGFAAAQATAYTKNFTYRGDAYSLLFDDYDSVTVELSVTDEARVRQLLRPTHVRTYTVDGIEITEGVSRVLTRSVRVDGVTVHFQLAKKDGRLLLGLPVIAGAY